MQYYGIGADPNIGSFYIVMEYAEDGSLEQYLQKKYKNITWAQKLEKLFRVANGYVIYNVGFLSPVLNCLQVNVNLGSIHRLEQIHKNGLIHCDLHSGNILLGVGGKKDSVKIGDLGLCREVGYDHKCHIYGILSYIAPEIFRGSPYTQASDIYSFGMIMWEFTTGHRPFPFQSHDIEFISNIVGGLRPKITNDTPKVFSDLMERCWNSNPSERPTIKEVSAQFGKWCWDKEDLDQFIDVEKKSKIKMTPQDYELELENNKTNSNTFYSYQSKFFDTDGTYKILNI